MGLRLRCFGILLLVASFSASAVSAQEDYLNHIVFRNSTTPDNDFYTGGHAVAPSTLEAPYGRLPVETKVFISPPNAIRLEWRSVEGGSWDAEVRTVSIDNRPSNFIGNTLSFWCYAPHAIAAGDLPNVQLTDDDSDFTEPVPIAGFIHALPAGSWVQVRIPLARFSTESVRSFNSRLFHSIFFEQSSADNQPHTLFVDDIQIVNDVPDAQNNSSLLAAPSELEAKGYERHVDLQWKADDSSGLEYFLVYRSLNGGGYHPIGIQEPGINRYADFIGKVGAHASYKVVAVGNQYRQSAFSNIAEARTHHLSDDQLLTMLQEACFRYYWERGSHPVSGMTLESVPGDPRIVATGASGFGIMALVVGMNRGFITRQQGIERLEKITAFLGKAQRYHGAWPHFMNGATGETMPVFGMFDNGGDIVETSFLMEGLLTARQYLNRDDPEEQKLYAQITDLWKSVEWDWYAKDTSDGAMLWHWSPQWSWRLHHRLTGFNETMVTYLLGMASPAHSIPAPSYYTGWASQSQEAERYRVGWSGATGGRRYINGTTYEGVKLEVGVGGGGPLFFTQYSFMGPDPHKITDSYTNYFENNRNIALINYRYCLKNPGKFKGYGAGAWGLTASLDPFGYAAHSPDRAHDNGTISPTAALGSFPYTPEQSLAALKYFYRVMGDRLWGIYGPRDAYNLNVNWFAPVYLGLDQAPITVMIENARTGLIWKTFMSNPEVEPMLAKIRQQPAPTLLSTAHAATPRAGTLHAREK